MLATLPQIYIICNFSPSYKLLNKTNQICDEDVFTSKFIMGGQKRILYVSPTVQIDPLMVPHRFFFCENSEETHRNVGL
jgi:hypothetical protein